MAIAFVQSASGAGVASGAATTGNITTTSGNAIVVVGGVNTNTANDITNVTDNKSNTYTRAVQKNANASEIEIWYCLNITGGATHNVTATSANAARNVVVIAQEFSGVLTAGAFDVAKGNSGTSASPTSTPSDLIAQNDELVFGGLLTENSGAISLGNGFSNLATETTIAALRPAAESKIVSSSNPQTATFTIGASQAYECAVVTFRGSVINPGKSFRQNNLRPHPFSPGLAR